MSKIVVGMWFVACALGLLSGVLVLLFKRPGVQVLGAISTFALLKEPGKYVRQPIASVVRIFTVSALAIFALSICVVIARNVYL